MTITRENALLLLLPGIEALFGSEEVSSYLVNHTHRLHSLWPQWDKMRREKGALSKDWRRDFVKFALDVGNRPGPNHRPVPINPNKPMSISNFQWREPETSP